MEIHYEKETIKVLDGKKLSGSHVSKILNGYIITVWAHVEDDGPKMTEAESSEKYYVATKEDVKEFLTELSQIEVG